MTRYAYTRLYEVRKVRSIWKVKAEPEWRRQVVIKINDQTGKVKEFYEECKIREYEVTRDENTPSRTPTNI